MRKYKYNIILATTYMAKQIILDKEQEICNNIKKINLEYTLDNNRNYWNSRYKNGSRKSRELLAQHIHDNYDKMDISEMKFLALKCLSDTDYKRILLEYELQNKPSDQKNDTLELDEFISKAVQILNKYQSKGGGYKLEDTCWKLVKDDDSVIFENTIDSKLVNDDELNIYLDKIVERLSELSMNIDTELYIEKYQKERLVVIRIISTKN